MWWRLTSAATVSSKATPDHPFLSPSKECRDGGCRLCFLGAHGDNCNKSLFLCVDGDMLRLPFRGLEGDSCEVDFLELMGDSCEVDFLELMGDRCEVDFLELMGDKWKLIFLDLEGDMSSEDLDPVRSARPSEE